MSYFVTVLTDTCEVAHHTYSIHTQVHQFTYRIEVFQNGTLIDTLEKKASEANYSTLHAQYRQAHKEMRIKHCTLVDNEKAPVKEPSSTLLTHTKYTQKKIFKMILISSIVLFSLFFIFRTFFIYSNLYIDMFYTTVKEKIVYLEQIEPQRHMLSKTCLTLAKKERLEDDVFSIRQCKTWCAKHVIQSDTCALFDAYRVRNYTHKETMAEKQNSTIEHNISSGYVVLPEEDLVLSKNQDVTLQIHNLNPYVLDVRVKRIVLEHNHYEEIVQFRDAVSTVQLYENEAKNLVLFLEPTYYEQFKKGAYSGHIEFEINYQGKERAFIKKFSFVIK